MERAGTTRRPLNTSCQSCRERKIRCDAWEGKACTACVRAGIPCQLHPKDRRSARSRRRAPDVDYSNAAVPPTAAAPLATGNNSNKLRTSPSLRPEPADSGSSSEALTSFLERGLLSADWQSFEVDGQIRLVYIGTKTSNLSHLIRNNERLSGDYLHYPFPPSSIPWKPLTGHATAPGFDDLGSLPTKPVRDALVDTYFRDIHPGCPVIDEESFRRQYADPTDPPPLLVYQAVLLAAARICDHPLVSASRKTVTATLFRRTKSLYDMRHENDRLHLIQAALLMASHSENGDSAGSNAFFWIGAAVRTSFGLGMHRRPASRHLPIADTGVFRTYRKVWWSLVHAEVFLAVDLGRPCMIRAEDFDVGGLEDEHFKNVNGSADHLVNRTYCTTLNQLTLLALDNLKLFGPRGYVSAEQRATVSNRLAAFSLHIPPLHDFWSCQLRINYNLLILVMHREDDAAETVHLCSTAASNILTTFETMIAQNTIRQASMTSSSALMAPAIQFGRDASLGQADSRLMKLVSAHGQLERLVVVAEKLSQVWPSVAAIHRLCMTLSSRAALLIKDREQRELSGPADMGQIDIAWEDFLRVDWDAALEPELGTAEAWMTSSS
ncbi:fungal-specific transcription factor domain-containing protein [Exophiala viscosa]|uniref:Fungal-specific transcription factor domain-containing protein n=1 Tax=Exophiala viscosa TaxID=2486360 RepID=A0AAN6E3Y3_9EURO|nr:fungal-specific transcription factor domain-containing protein [Exophiala viscosa]